MDQTKAGITGGSIRMQTVYAQLQVVKKYLELLELLNHPKQVARLESIVVSVLAVDRLVRAHCRDTYRVEIEKTIEAIIGLVGGLYTLLLNELFTEVDTCRITKLIHERIFSSLDYRVHAQANRQAEEYIHKRELEIQVRDLPRQMGGGRTVEELKRKIKEDLKIEMDFDIVILQKLVDDTSRSLDAIYMKFYLAELFGAEAPVRVREALQANSLPTMKVEFCIRGIGNHDQLPYIPSIVDQEWNTLVEQLTRAFLCRKDDDVSMVVYYFRVLQKLTQYGRYSQTIRKLCEILKVVCNNGEIQRQVFQCQGIVVLVRVFLMESNRPFQDAMITLIGDLLGVSQQRTRRLSQHLGTVDVQYFEQEGSTNLNLMLHSLGKFQDRDNILNVLLQVTPLIVKEDPLNCENLLQHFSHSFDFNQQQHAQLDQFSQILYYTPVHYQLLRNMVVQCGLLEQSYQVFQAAYPRTDCLEQLKVALRIVCSIAKANESLQLRLLQDGMLGSILALSISTDESLRHLSKVSDDFVTFLSVEQYVNQEVGEFIRRYQMDKQQAKNMLAQQKRATMMKKFNRVNLTYANKLKQIEDERGLSCQTCKEGYTLNPQALLGHSIPDEKTLLNSQTLYTETVGVQSVTYFTVMHLQCHKKAFDFACKNYQKEHEETGIRRSLDDIEWECAQKNNVAKCNSFFPIKPPTNQHILEQGLQFFNQRSDVISRQKGSSLFWTILNDSKLLFMAFAKGEDLSKHTGAGRFEHNIKLIPLQLTSLIYLIQKSINQIQYQLDNEHLTRLNQLFTQGQDDPNRTLHIIHLSLVAVLLTRPTAGWRQWKLKIVQLVQQLYGSDQSNVNTHIYITDEELYERKESRYLFNWIALVELIYQQFISLVRENSDYLKGLDECLTQDNREVQINYISKQTTTQFESIERVYSQRVLRATNFDEIIDLIR